MACDVAVTDAVVVVGGAVATLATATNPPYRQSLRGQGRAGEARCGCVHEYSAVD